MPTLSLSAITESVIKKATETELKFLVNGKEELTAAEFAEKYEGYTVEFKYNVANKEAALGADFATGKVKANADFKYAVQVKDAEGNIIPEAITPANFAKVKVCDATEATKINGVALFVGDKEWTADSVAKSDVDVKIAAKAWENAFAETNEDNDTIVKPVIEKVTSSDVTVAYYEDGIKVLKEGTVTFTVKFVGIEETASITVNVKDDQTVAGIDFDKTTAKVEAGKADTAVKFALLDKDGAVYRGDADVYYTATLKDANEADTATSVSAVAGVAEVKNNWAAGTYTVNVYKEVAKENKLGSFTFEAVAVEGTIADEYKLVFADEDKTELDLKTAGDTLTINVEAYVDGVKLGTVDDVLTGFEAKSSDEDIVDATLKSGSITATVGTKTGDAVITLVKVEGDLVTPYATTTVKVVNTTPQIEDLQLRDKVEAITAEAEAAAADAEDAIKAADVIAAVTAGKDKDGAEILTADMIEAVKFVERTVVKDEDTVKEVTGKVMVTINAINGGETFVFAGKVTVK